MRIELDDEGTPGYGVPDEMPRRRFLTVLPFAVGAAGWRWDAQQFEVPPHLGANHRRPNRLVYVVDDCTELTGLYASFLENAGYEVQAFNDRLRALAALRMSRRPPWLLVTDYFGYPISADEFVRQCRLIRADLRILMATGCPKGTVPLSSIQPDCYIEKPFCLQAILAEMKALGGTPGL
jgi:CheY-like chemotaxis protein